MLEKAKHFVESSATWLLGRGAVMVAMAGAVMLKNPYFALVALPIGAAFSAGMYLQSHKYREKRILNQYKDEISAVMGVEPDQVSVAQLRQVARGNPRLGIEPNPVLNEALGVNDRLRNHDLWARGLSVVATGLMLLSLSSGNLAGIGEVFGAVKDTVGTSLGFAAAGGALQFGGIVLAGGLLSGVLNLAFRHVIREFGGNDIRTAQSLIQDIAVDVKRGHTITPERVLEVYVAVNPEAAAAIKEKFGVAYGDLPSDVQQQLVAESGKQGELRQLAKDITARQVQPEELAFAAVGSASGVPRLAETPPTYKEEMLEKMRAQVKGISARHNGEAAETQKDMHAHHFMPLHATGKLSAIADHTPLPGLKPVRAHVAAVSVEGHQQAVADRYAASAEHTTRTQATGGFAAKELARRDAAASLAPEALAAQGV